MTPLRTQRPPATRFRPSLVFLQEDDHASLEMQAREIGLHADQLASRLLHVIIRNGLVRAVLDHFDE
jgi:hypothetical protein